MIVITKLGGETMKQSELIRWGGLLGMIGATLLIVGSIIHPPVENPETIVSQAWPIAHILGAKGLLLLLVGLTAIYLTTSAKMGKVGLLGFVLTFAGMAQLYIINTFAALVEPVLAKNTPQLLDMNGPLFQSSFGIFFMATVITAIVGFLLFGFSIWKTNKAKWTGVVIIVGTLPFLMFFIKPETPEYVYNIGFIIVGLGFLGLSRQVWGAKS